MHIDFYGKPAFTIVNPKGARTPLIFNSPHSGSYYPEHFLKMTKLDEHSIRLSEDAFVDELFANAPKFGTTLIKAHFPRSYLDVNREPYELDQSMFLEKLPSHFNINSKRVAAGIGTIAKIVAPNKEIYAQKLTLREAIERIETIYRPYHLTLQKLLTKTLNQFGVALLIDCHSMPSQTRAKFLINPYIRPKQYLPADIVLGDRYGISCANIIVDIVENYFVGQGLNVVRNRPYPGGFITRSYANPANNIHTLQIEIARHLYMDEKKIIKNENFRAIQQIIDGLIKMLSEIDIVALCKIQSDAAQ